uniref:Uncharacterized protein n=1 Tax=Acanthochromis polyacanthus TaxID=80966 RepID=A0A3Q1FZI4_9TELE
LNPDSVSAYRVFVRLSAAPLTFISVFVSPDEREAVQKKTFTKWQFVGVFVTFLFTVNSFFTLI